MSTATAHIHNLYPLTRSEELTQGVSEAEV